MADLPPLYPADPGSPFTTLAAPYTTGDTTVTLTDASTRLAAPNLLCLEGAPGSGVLLYTGIDGNTLTGVSQIEGPTDTWPSGSYAYRGFTAYDHNALIENVSGSSFLETWTITEDPVNEDLVFSYVGGS